MESHPQDPNCDGKGGTQDPFCGKNAPYLYYDGDPFCPEDANDASKWRVVDLSTGTTVTGLVTIACS